MGRKVDKLREDHISNISLNRRFDALEHCLRVLDYPIICACSICSSYFSVDDRMIFCEKTLSCHLDDVGGIWDDAAVYISCTGQITFSFLGADVKIYNKGR